MAAPKENTFWKLRAKHGRDKLFSDPDTLLSCCYEYFAQCDKNPWYKNEAIKSGDRVGETVKVPTQRPYTQTGLFIFLNIDRRTWDLYSKREDFIPVITHVEDVIYTQKFEGAAVGAFNANIIARDLGLKESTENKNTNTNYTSEPLTVEKIKEINKALEDEY
jgi:hypothetical protein